MLLLALFIAAVDSSVAGPSLCGTILTKRPQLACGVCMEIRAGQDCQRYDACECMGPGRVNVNCTVAGYCESTFGQPLEEIFGLRVSKGHGSRDYATIRLSMITKSPSTPASPGFFDYSGKFRYRWTANYIHTAVKTVTPGQVTEFTVGSSTVQVKIPKQGEGVAGVLIGDPCFRSASITSFVLCQYAEKFQTATRSPSLLNAFVGSSDVDYWGMLGDNLYDRTGWATSEFFSKLSQAVKETPLVTVAGNHDYWILGSPEFASVFDQCGNGHMQSYAQDSEAASRVMAGENSAPFNYSVNPSAGHILLGCNKAAPDNSRFFHQIGNLGIIAQSGVFTLDEYKPFMAQACAWLAATPGIRVGMIIGHWDVPDLGVQKDMDVPGFFEHMATLPGCDKLNAAGNLKFFMGHTHCNVPHPHRHNGTGFMVAGQGMQGCGNYGVPVFDTSEGRNRVYYFDTSTDMKYMAVLSCVGTLGWRNCLFLADTWLDESQSTVASSISTLV